MWMAFVNAYKFWFPYDIGPIRHALKNKTYLVDKAKIMDSFTQYVPSEVFKNTVSMLTESTFMMVQS